MVSSTYHRAPGIAYLSLVALALLRLWPWSSGWTEQWLEWLPCYADPRGFEPTAIGVFRAIPDDLKLLPHTQPGRKTFHDIFREFDRCPISKHEVFDLPMFAIPQVGHRPARAYLPQADGTQVFGQLAFRRRRGMLDHLLISAGVRQDQGFDLSWASGLSPDCHG